MESPKKNTMYWILLPVGVVVILAAVFVVGKVMSSKMTKPTNTPSSPAQVILDENAAEQERADRITLGETGNRVADEEAKREKEKQDKEKEKADAERAKVEVEQTTGDDAANTDENAAGTGQEKTKALITTEPDDAGGAGTADAADAAKTDAGAQTDGTIYRLQLGVFGSEESAKKVAAEARAETGLSVIIGKKTVNGKTMYRLQCGAFTDKEKAQSYARELELKGLTVFVSEEKK